MGAAKIVKIPVRIMETLEIVPEIEPNSKALDVPEAWALVPRRTPRAIQFSIRRYLMIIGPMILPMIPVRTTKTAVMAGIPPMLCEISIAIEAVTE